MATATSPKTDNAEDEAKTAKATESEQHDTFPFLELPPEIRVMVYRELFAMLPKAGDDASKHEAEPTALLQVCSVVRHEASNAFKQEVIAQDHDLSRHMHARPDKVLPFLQAGSPTFQRDLAEFSNETGRLCRARDLLCNLLRRCLKRYELHCAQRQAKAQARREHAQRRW